MILGQERIRVRGMPSIFYDVKTVRKSKKLITLLVQTAFRLQSWYQFHSHYLEESMKRKIGIITYILCSGNVMNEVYSVCVRVLSRLSRVRLRATPWTVGHLAPLSMGLLRQESSLGDCPDPGIERASLMSSALAGRFFTTSGTWEAPYCMTNSR